MRGEMIKVQYDEWPELRMMHKSIQPFEVSGES